MNIVTWPYRLRKGHSDNPAEGACAMDAVNWLVHGKHGDAPECACPVIAAYVIRGNDAMPDDIRQRLLPSLHRIAGSRSVGHQEARLRILVLAAVRVFAPRALDAAGLREHAALLRALPDDVDWTAARATAATAAAAGAAAARATAAEAAAAWTTAAWARRRRGRRRGRRRRRRGRRRATAGRRRAAAAAAAAAAWDDYFLVLDQALNAGPQGEAWSADVIAAGAAHYRAAKGAEVLVS